MLQHTRITHAFGNLYKKRISYQKFSSKKQIGVDNVTHKIYGSYNRME